MKPIVAARSIPAADLRVFDNAETLACSVAGWLCALARDGRRDFAVCLSGGSTPQRLYQLLAQPPIAPRFPWDRVHWFWGDERFVPHEHPDSNYRMAYEALLSQVPVPAVNVHAIPTEGLSPEQAANEYEATLRRFHRRPLFDVTLLGIGEDGHTASLFPGAPALEEERRWVVAVDGASAEPRITLTYPALNSSRDVAFLASGSAKSGVVRRAQAGDGALPAARIRPAGRLHWFTDRTTSP